MDIIGHINSNVSWSAAKKTAMLVDFVHHIGYQDQVTDENGDLVDNPVTKKDFANDYLKAVIRNAVHAQREKEAREASTYTELDAFE